MAETEMPLAESMYPEVEALVEKATEEDISSRFEELRTALNELKGPRAEQGKKVRKALDRAEELFLHLLGIRQNLSPQPGTSRK
jgi:hypothetical protein